MPRKIFKSETAQRPFGFQKSRNCFSVGASRPGVFSGGEMSVNSGRFQIFLRRTAANRPISSGVKIPAGACRCLFSNENRPVLFWMNALSASQLEIVNRRAQGTRFFKSSGSVIPKINIGLSIPSFRNRRASAMPSTAKTVGAVFINQAEKFRQAVAVSVGFHDGKICFRLLRFFLKATDYF